MPLTIPLVPAQRVDGTDFAQPTATAVDMSDYKSATAHATEAYTP